ncbi:MAG: hypothetical protein PF480_13475, partial [Roseovarius sp.]|nr:hypothetical protein [Roseovarius sp.]
ATYCTSLVQILAMQDLVFSATSHAMDWEDVKTFREVMDAGTVRAAAKQLGCITAQSVAG